MTTRLALLLLCLAAPAAAAVADDDFRVTGATGEAAVIPSGDDAASPATSGLPLSPGDRIVTGPSGRVELAAQNGTIFRLEPNSSFAIEAPTSRWSSFRLQVGRLLAKFAASKDRPYRVNTPVAVAAIRGTELILDVTESGALQGGVVEGEVAFGPPTEADAAAWSGVNVSSGGIEILPEAKPRRMSDIPARLRPAVAAFPSIRERVPKLRASWKQLAPSQRASLRREALRERVRWTVPAKLRDRIPPPGRRHPPLPRRPRRDAR